MTSRAITRLVRDIQHIEEKLLPTEDDDDETRLLLLRRKRDHLVRGLIFRSSSPD